MKLSKTFVKTFREVGKEETAANGKLLIQAGYISKEMAGVYTFLPLGLKVMENIKNIIREELNKIDCEEFQMTALQNPEPWQKTNRWDSEQMDIWFKTDLSAGGQLGLAPTHENTSAPTRICQFTPINSRLSSATNCAPNLVSYVPVNS